ncbi:aquaporin [Candidatus Saccharibacteria bacterium]|nr:aquaporin [Candidatus Saccharibacteria bacterium]MCL1963195.1 aquaporin [Candidatus Saccharibacteria bacterium]
MATKTAAPKKKISSASQKPTAKKTVKTTKTNSKPAVAKKEAIVKLPEVVVEVAEVANDTATTVKAPIKDKFLALKPGALIAEFLGTFILAASVIHLSKDGLTGVVGIGLVLSILVIVLGVISGAHLNPAITIAQYINRKIDGVRAAFYVFVQVLGATAAMLLLVALYNSNYDYMSRLAEALQGATGASAQQIADAGGVAEYLNKNYGMTVEDAAKQLGVQDKAPDLVEHKDLAKGKEWVALLTELIASIVFGLGVGYAVFSEEKCKIAKGFAVGLSLFAGLVIGGAVVALNPAVAGAISKFAWENPFGKDAMIFWWPVFIYIFATVGGMTLGMTAYRFILKDVAANK